MTQVYPLKCRIRNDGALTRVDVYDDIGAGGWFADGVSAADFASQMAGVKGSVEVHINSAGGDVFDGIAIGNTLRGHKGRVTTVVDGLAASIASVIAQSGQERVIQPGAMLMIHDAFGGCVGDAAEMMKMADTLDGVSENIAGIYASRSGRGQDYWRDQMKQETWYTADKAIEAGLADRLGEGAAALPESLDLAALGKVPGRIAAKLRRMPVAADGNHAPMSGTHTHMHPAYGSQGGDQMHSHEHSHDGDASHGHGHAAAGHGGRVRGDAAGPCCDMCGPDCACQGSPMTAAAAMHGDHVRVDPDGDGDCDACPEGDTDHDYWSEDGGQLKPLFPAADSLLEAIRAVVREEIGIYAADKYKQEDRDRMAKSGQAMPDGSYPIADEEDLDNAIHAVGRGGADHDAIRKHIIQRAKALGLSSKIPDNWNADGSLADLATTDVSGGMTPEQIRAALRGATE